MQADMAVLHSTVLQLTSTMADLQAQVTDGRTAQQHLTASVTGLTTMVDGNSMQLADMQAALGGMSAELKGVAEKAQQLGIAVQQQKVEQARALEDSKSSANTVAELAAKVAGMVKAGGEKALPPSTLALHLFGINSLRQSMRSLLAPEADPVEVVRRLLREAWMEAFMTRIQLVGGRPGDSRQQVNSVIIHFTSNFHKNEAAVQIKRVLVDKGLHDVSIEDCFPAESLQEVRRLKAYGGHLKRDGQAAKYRVINRHGRPVLQVGLNANGGYGDEAYPPASFQGGPAEAGAGQQQLVAASIERQQMAGGAGASGGQGNSRRTEDEPSGQQASQGRQQMGAARSVPEAEVAVIRTVQAPPPAHRGRQEERRRPEAAERRAEGGQQRRGGERQRPPRAEAHRGQHNSEFVNNVDRSERFRNMAGYGGQAQQESGHHRVSWSHGGHRGDDRRPVPAHYGGPRPPGHPYYEAIHRH
jgi:uncharacterized protein YoxC